MARGPRSIYRQAQPIRSLAQRFAYISMVAAAVGLMILGKVDVLLMDSIRAHVTDTVAPILDALSRPVESVAKAIDHVRQLSALGTGPAALSRPAISRGSSRRSTSSTLRAAPSSTRRR